MAYTITTTRATGYTVTATDWNVFANNFTSLRADTCGVARTAVQSIPDTTPTAMLWDAENWDPATMHSLVGDTEKVNILRNGIYHINTLIAFDANGTGIRRVAVWRSGAAVLVQEDRAPDGTNYDYFSVNTVSNLSAGDYVTVEVTQTSTGALNVLRPGARSPSLAVTLLYDQT